MNGRIVFGALALALFLLAKPACAAPPVEAYGRLPAMEEVHLSPSGERYAFIATDGEKRRLFVSTFDNKPLQIAEVGSAKVRDVAWAGDDHVLITLSSTVVLGPDFKVWQQELRTVVSLNVLTGKSVQVFHNQQSKMVDVVIGSYGTAQVDGHWYGWFGGQGCESGKEGCYSIHDYVDLFRVDLDSGATGIAARGRTDSDGWLVSNTGEIAARSLYDQKSGNWQILAGRDGDQVLAGGHNAFGGAGELEFGHTADTILVAVPTGATGEDKNSYVYRELPVHDGAGGITVDPSQIDVPVIDPATHLWIGETLLKDFAETTFFSPTLQARWKGSQKAFPNYIVQLKSWSSDFNRLAVFTEGGDDVGTYWVVDIQKHSAVPVGSQYPDVKPADVGAIQMVDWRAADGMQLHGVLTLPPGKQPKSLPLVVLPHGGPEDRDYLRFDWWAQAYASRGYAVFQPNFRGSSGYGAAYFNAGLGQWGRKMQTDISDGVADLARKGIVDPKRTCIVGASYGGYAALAGVTVQQGLYRCAVSVAGVADLSGMLAYVYKRSDGPQSSGLRYMKEFMGVSGFSASSQLAPFTPVALANKADAPILLIHGRDDTRVPIEQSEDMASALRSAGKPVEFVKMNNEDHFLSREATRVEMLKSAVAFVEKHNPAN